MRKHASFLAKLTLSAILMTGITAIHTPALADGGGGSGGSIGGGSSAPSYDPVKEYEKGIKALKEEDFKKASSAFGKVLRVAKKDANSNYLMGLSQAGLEKHKKASKYYEKAIKYNADLFQAYPALASSYKAQGKMDEANTVLSDISNRIATCGECDQKASLEETKAKIEAAINGVQQETFLWAPQKSQMAAANQYFDAVALINRARYAEAIEQLNIMSAYLGPHPDVMNYLGYAHRKSGKFEKAEAYYKVALAVDPKHRGANEYLGELYIETGQMDKAREQLRTLEAICTFGCAEEIELRGWIINAAP